MRSIAAPKREPRIAYPKRVLLAANIERLARTTSANRCASTLSRGVYSRRAHAAEEQSGAIPRRVNHSQTAPWPRGPGQLKCNVDVAHDAGLRCHSGAGAYATESADAATEAGYPQGSMYGNWGPF